MKRGEEQKTLTDEAGKEVKKIKKLNSKACWSKWTNRLARTLKRFDQQDRVRLTLGMLRLASEGADLRRELCKYSQFEQFVREVRDARDEQISKHLRETLSTQLRCGLCCASCATCPIASAT